MPHPTLTTLSIHNTTQTIPTNPNKTHRRGLRDDALSEACGVPGGVFVHASGFIGGNATYEGALAMARKAIAFEEGMTDELVGIST